MRKDTPICLKRYLLMHRVSRRRQYVEADLFQSACEQLGWLPAETCMLKATPLNSPLNPTSVGSTPVES